MRWNQFARDQARAQALGDLLLGAALAGGPLDDVKRAVVDGQVAKALGVGELPADVMLHAACFDPTRFDPGEACKTLGLVDLRDRVLLMKTVVTVLRAEGPIGRTARSYALRLAAILDLPLAVVIDLVGMPARPTTGPRPRPSLQMVGPGCSGARA